MSQIYGLEVDGQMDEVDGEMDNVDRKTDNVNGKTDNVNGKMDNVDEIKENVDGKTDNIEVFFNPIISFNRKVIVGFRCELIERSENIEISYLDLRKNAIKEKNLIEFEIFCLEKQIEKFKKFISEHDSLCNAVLFLSIDARLISSKYVSYKRILAIIHNSGISERTIALTLTNYKATNIYKLMKFAVAVRKKGVIIALDDVGSKFSNLETITGLNPEILKVNINNLKSIHKEFHKKGVLTAMSGLAKSLGALMCCKAVDSSYDAILSIDTGADLLQGNYFYNRNIDKNFDKEIADNRIKKLSEEYKNYIDCRYKSTNNIMSEFNVIASRIAHNLSLVKKIDYEHELISYIESNELIEAAYVLDKSGIKITETIFANKIQSKNRKAIFKPSSVGSDYSSKIFYYKVVRDSTGFYVTDPYISCASGNLCTTVSTIFMDENADEYVLCLDFNSDKQNISISCLL